MNKRSTYIVGLFVALGLPLLLPSIALAQSAGDVGQVESFIRNVIQAVAGLAGLIATGFFVVGGFGYITSSGNPETLERSKRTLIFSGVGLAITIGAFVLSNIVTGLARGAFGG
jgi:type II secretory pathway pseudopilin PulG